MQGILQIMEPLEQQGVLVKRSVEQLERDIDKYFVLEAEGNILGCAALYLFGERKTAELAALAVNPFYRDGGRGERLLAYAEVRAKAAGLRSHLRALDAHDALVHRARLRGAGSVLAARAEGRALQLRSSIESVREGVVMARMVNCIKLKKEAEGLDFPPYPGELGKSSRKSVSKEAWKPGSSTRRCW